jgi:hypothetical protein
MGAPCSAHAWELSPPPKPPIENCLTGTEHSAWIEFVGSNPLPTRTNGYAQRGSPARDSLPLAPRPRELSHAATARAGLLRNRFARKPFENSRKPGRALLAAVSLAPPYVLQAG